MLRSSRSSALRGSAGVALSMVAMNITTYGFTFVAVYLLGPKEYGVTASLMGLFTVASVLSLGLQATAARQVAAVTAARRHLENRVQSLARWCALLIFLVTLSTIPLVERYLRIHDTWSVIMVGLAVAPLTIVGGQAGILQGGRHWLGLSLVYLATGIPRLVIGAAFILLSPTALMSMAGVAAAAWVPVLVGTFAVRAAAAPEPLEPDVEAPTTELKMFSETVHNSHALALYFLLSTIDVLIARATFDAHTAGLYAGAAILTKMVMFLPSFVVVLAFPAMARATRESRVHLRALALVAGIGAVAIAGTWLLPSFALIFAGGDSFAQVEGLLPWFATLGTVLAMLQLMVYHSLARQLRAAVWLLWITAAASVLAGSQGGSIQALVVTVSLIDAAVLLALIGLALRNDNRAVRGESSVDHPRVVSPRS